LKIVESRPRAANIRNDPVARVTVASASGAAAAEGDDNEMSPQMRSASVTHGNLPPPLSPPAVATNNNDETESSISISIASLQHSQHNQFVQQQQERNSPI
jgi:hypothetical protein